MALTAAQIADLRLVIGDDENQVDSAPILSDDNLQTLYVLANENIALTRVLALRRILGFYAKKVSMQNLTGTTERFDQLFRHTKELLEYYEMVFARFGGHILGESETAFEPPLEGIGGLSLDINYSEDDYDEGRYPSGI